MSFFSEKSSGKPRTTLRIGTRGSKLALIQCAQLSQKLTAALARDAQTPLLEIVPIETSGDWIPGDKERCFADMGANKGLFAKEIQQALLDHRIDLAVHSAKDLETIEPEGLMLAAFLPRADARDAFICRHTKTLRDLPQGARVGTCSVRRKAQILAMRPDLVVQPMRGNVDTRLRKLDAGDVDATILALAGLQRMGRENEVASLFTLQDMMPAAGQGAIAIEIRVDDDNTRRVVESVNCKQTMSCVMAERALLMQLGGSCHTPIGALMTIENGIATMRALAASPDGKLIERIEGQAPEKDALALGNRLGNELKKKLPPDFFRTAA